MGFEEGFDKLATHITQIHNKIQQNMKNMNDEELSAIKDTIRNTLIDQLSTWSVFLKFSREQYGKLHDVIETELNSRITDKDVLPSK